MFDSVPIDKVRSYWNSRPCNIRHSPEPLGTKLYFEQVTARKYLVEPHIVEFAEFPKWWGKKVLEIGCGIGTDTMSFALSGARVTAVDLSDESLKVAQQRAQLYGVDVKFYQANCEELSKTVPVEEYDLIYSFGVLHHTPHPERALKEIQRYMGAKTELRIMMYHKWSFKALWILFRYGWGQFWKMSELIARYSEAQEGCPVTYAYSRKDIRQFLHTLFFSVLSVRVEHIFPYSIPEYKRYQYKLAFPFNLMPNWFFRWLEKRIGWHLLVTAKLS
jgi:ubiquinone/menaquinone biosynthesis C-methylase UbiE